LKIWIARPLAASISKHPQKIISRKTKNAVVKSTELSIVWSAEVVDLVAIGTSLIAAEESRLECL
jgi:hypothetical protein